MLLRSEKPPKIDLLLERKRRDIPIDLRGREDRRFKSQRGLLASIEGFQNDLRPGKADDLADPFGDETVDALNGVVLGPSDVKCAARTSS